MQKTNKNNDTASNTDQSEVLPPIPEIRSKKFTWIFTAAATFGVAGYALHDELMVSSRIQSKIFSSMYKGDSFSQKTTTPPPAKGNTDVERGYSEVERIRRQATESGDKVSDQVPWIDRKVGPYRLAPIFDRKQQAGIVIKDVNGAVMYQSASPRKVYGRFTDVPEVVINSFCAVEDKNICDPDKAPTYNAAINWWRASQAALMGMGKSLHLSSKVEGGSTLPIQITKNDSWERGITRGFTDKAEQMLTASVEMYALGPDTTEQRKNKILEYINTASFAGHPRFGEIKGVRDAMAILFGDVTYDEKLKQMKDDDATALAFRRFFSLVMSVKMPDENLRTESGFKNLQDRVDRYLGVLVSEDVISESFAKKVGKVKLSYENLGKSPAFSQSADRDKFIDSLRLSVMNKLNLNPTDGMYKLDRWDIRIDGTLDAAVNAAVTNKLKSFNDPDTAKANGLVGYQLLRPESVPKVIWALTINEIMPDGRVVTRVSTDTFKGALDLTKNGRQNYGSTGKMRMAVTFLEVIAELHDKLSNKTEEDLNNIKVNPRDKLTQWAITYLKDPLSDHTLMGMQRAAISSIEYSGRPQGFFTGGGMNYPGNFDPKENSQNYTVEDALWQSVNLSWYRISDDIEEYMKWGRLGIDPGILDNEDPTEAQKEERRKYLEAFANYEGTTFIARAWRKQKARVAEELSARLAKNDGHYTTHLTALYLGLYPEAKVDNYLAFMDKYSHGAIDKEELRHNFSDHQRTLSTSSLSDMASHTDGSMSALVTLFRYLTPNATYDQTKDFVLALKKQHSKKEKTFPELEKAYNDYVSPVPAAVLSLMVEKAKGFKTKLAVVYMSLYPEATQDEFEAFMRKECTSCKADEDLGELYKQYKPEHQVDILNVLISGEAKQPLQIIKLYKTIYPDLGREKVREHLAKYSPEIASLKSFDGLFAQVNDTYTLEELSKKTDGSADQLAALIKLAHPQYSLGDMRSFVAKHIADKKQIIDYKKLYHKYFESAFDPQALFYNFDLNDRGYLARPVHPLELVVSAQRIKNPEITWNEVLDKTAADRITVYKWLIHSNKKKAQDRAIGIMVDQKAWKEIGKQWRSVGYPFRLVPSLATVIGVSGDTPESLARLNAIFLSGGKMVNATRISDIHMGEKTPYETHIHVAPEKPVQVMRESTAELMLEMTRGVVASEHGTGRRLKDGFTLDNGQVLDVRGKTGTNDESETSGLRVGVFAGTIGDRYAVCLSAYITGATGRDKFTSGLAVQALKMLGPELKPLFEHSYAQHKPKEITAPDSALAQAFRKKDIMAEYFSAPKKPANQWQFNEGGYDFLQELDKPIYQWPLPAVK